MSESQLVLFKGCWRRRCWCERSFLLPCASSRLQVRRHKPFHIYCTLFTLCVAGKVNDGGEKIVSVGLSALGTLA